MKRSFGRLVAVVFCLLIPAVSQAGVDARMLRFPDVSDTSIAFVFAGDIWVVSKDGGSAHRLSTPAGEESFPRFSPDGRSIAFSGNYDGNVDVYVIPTTGGVPTRVTYHPLPDRALDWFPEGREVLFASFRESGKLRFRQFFRVSPEGGLPERLPVPYGEFGTIAPDGRTLVYMPVSRDFRTWKRYRGGMASDLWSFDLETHESKLLTDDDANDGQPMMHGSTLYFLSDRDGQKRANIWARDMKTGDVRQVTKFKEFDVRFPAIGPSEIVFENGAGLFLLDLETEDIREVEVDVVTDLSTLKPRRVNVGGMVTSGDISPTGKRAVIAARGEVFAVPAEHGVIRNLTRSSGAAERYPAWSPDGSEIAYFSDRSGEYELTVVPAGGAGEEQTLTSMGEGYRYNPSWSPDGRKLAFVDQAMRIQYFDRDAGNVVQIDQGLWMMHGALSAFRVSWSRDSRWIAYSRGIENRNGVLFLFDTRDRELHRLTTGFYSDMSPVFDPDGAYLYALTNRTFEPSYSDFDNSWIYANATSVAAIALRKDVPSPLAPRNDEEPDNGDDGDNGDDSEDEPEADEEKKSKKKKDKDSENGDDAAADEDAPEPVEIDLEGIETRLVVLPPGAGNYGDLHAVSGKVLYVRRPATGSGEENSPIVYYDLEEREEKTVLDNADGFTVSRDGKKLLVVRNGKFAIIDLKEGAKIEDPLPTQDLETELDPVAEWRQIFDDVWRIERDFFYDPDMHGVDWDAMRKRYGALLDDAVTRWDVNFILGELIGELNASHAYRGGGDAEQPAQSGVGMLGVDFALENGAYHIARILRGAAWDTEVRSPLDLPGVEVAEGDYVLAVNGTPLDTGKAPWAAFQGLAGRTIALTVNDRPDTEGSREVVVETLESENRLRNLAWIESKRRHVDAATDGRVGYIYVPSTEIDGQTELVRMFTGQFTKDALIIDERFNDGGQIPDRFVELLNRPLFNYWGVRDGKDWPWPPVAHFGPMVMLINEWSGSGGDAFPFYFRAAGLGPLIGTRTWGGLIGISGAPMLIDGGVATVPTFGMYSPDGEWIIEGYGVDPDVEVEDDPALMVDGGDPQLDRAIQEVEKLLESRPHRSPGKPSYPDRSGY